MKEKKHIDRLYQEKFREFEATPRDAVWNAIAAKLKEKEEEKKPLVPPLWSRLAGVAAIFAFLLLIGDWILPVQTEADVAIEEPEEITPSGTSLTNNAPKNADFSVTSSEAEPVAASKTPAEKKITSTSGEKSRVAEIAASEINRENIAFKISSLVAPGISAQIDKEKSKTEKTPLLDELLKEEETEIAAVKRANNFEVSTHAAPIYYGNLGNGSFLDPRFNNNSSEGEVTYSYGINVAYNLSNKIKIRSGINKVNMSYNTNGVAYQAIAGEAPLKSVSLEKGATMTHPTGGVISGRKSTNGTLRNPAGFLSPGNLNQKMGYLEVPVELEYNLFANKFELNLIGGASTLFLEENEVSLNAETVSAEGRANNLNNVSFSTNIGIGLDYNLTGKFKLNLEPMLKYQLNTFETSSPDTRPYYFGIYSGFSYKF